MVLIPPQLRNSRVQWGNTIKSWYHIIYFKVATINMLVELHTHSLFKKNLLIQVNKIGIHNENISVLNIT